MIDTHEALKSWERDEMGYYKLILENGYEVNLEPLIFDEQWYLAIYKDQSLVTPKVVVKVGKPSDYKNPVPIN
jgi:hypothetical protein